MVASRLISLSLFSGTIGITTTYGMSDVKVLSHKISLPMMTIVLV